MSNFRLLNLENYITLTAIYNNREIELEIPLITDPH